ncbi:MAG: ATP-binding protein, partial [Candidatus Binataceae bacterium]
PSAEARPHQAAGARSGRPASGLRFVDVNREFEIELGYSRAEVMCKPSEDFNFWVDPQTKRRFVRQLFDRGSVRNMEAELRSKDGRPIACLMSGSMVELRGQRCAVILGQKISELKKIQRELKDSEETFRTLFDTNLDAVSIIDLATGKYIDVNPEFIRATGLSREEIVGRSSRESSRYMHGDQLERYADELRKNGEARNIEVLFNRPDGGSVPVLFSGKLVQLHGHPCCVTIARNISVLKQTERELIEAREAALAASHAKSEFLSSMSHEIRTPMSAVLGMADLLAETRLDAEQRKYLEVMINNGNTLLDLINDILDLAKVESGRVELEQAGFDLNELTARVCETLAVRAHGKRLELAAHIVPGVPTDVVGDPMRLRQILTNLIANAIKFTDKGSVIVTVDCGQGGPGLFHFSVADTGIGIAADHLDRIFGTFTQAESSISRKYGGTGLGLAIARRLVELMGGRIWVESEVGKGSTFHFTVRLGVQAAQANPVDSPDKAIDLKGLRALIVDDTPVNRLILREMLSAAGAEVEEVESGEQALARLARAAAAAKPYDLLVLDCRMPGMDGIEVARRIKAGHAGCRVITLMVTSDDFSLGTAPLHELGIHARLLKPIRRAELYQAIAKAIAAASGSAAIAPPVPVA